MIFLLFAWIFQASVNWWRYRWIRPLVEGVHVHDVERTFPFEATEKLAEKVCQVCWRALFFARVVVVPTMPSEAFQIYVERILGRKTTVLVPGGGYKSGVLNTLAAALSDNWLIVNLRQIGGRVGGYVSHKLLVDLSEKTGLKYVGVSGRGLAALERAANKCSMAKIFKKLGLRPHRGVTAKNFSEFLCELRKRLKTDSKAFCRQGGGDGGLGNVMFWTDGETYFGRFAGKGQKTHTDDSLEQLLEAMGIDTKWCESGVRVEKHHHLHSSPAVLIHINRWGWVRVIQVHQQKMDESGDGACIGILRHYNSKALFAENPDLYRKLWRAGLKVGRFFARRGVRDTIMSVDAIDCREGILFSEVNARQTASCVGLFIGYMLRLLSDRVILTNDQFQTQCNDLLSVLALLKENGLHYNPETRCGIIITNEPKEDGSMGMLVAGLEVDEVMDLYFRAKHLIGKKKVEEKVAQAA